MTSGDYTEDLSAAQRQDLGESYSKKIYGLEVRNIYCFLNFHFKRTVSVSSDTPMFIYLFIYFCKNDSLRHPETLCLFK